MADQEYNETTGSVNDSSYVQRGESTIPVQSDSAPIDDPIDSKTADSDAQLERDDKDAIDESNIIDKRTRGAKPTGSLSEGPDEDDLPETVASGNDGTSRVAY